LLPLQEQFALHGAGRLAADQLAGARGLLPYHLAQRVPAAVGAHALELDAGAAARGPVVALGGLDLWPRRRRRLGSRVDPLLAGGPPDRPGAEHAERVARL